MGEAKGRRPACRTAPLRLAHTPPPPQPLPVKGSKGPPLAGFQGAAPLGGVRGEAPALLSFTRLPSGIPAPPLTPAARGVCLRHLQPARARAGKPCFPAEAVAKRASQTHAGPSIPAAGPSQRNPTPHGITATALAASQDHFQGEDFASLLDETLGKDTGFDGSVVTGRVVRLTEEFAIVDVGLKSEGRVALKEFAPPGGKPEVKPGDVIELYVERYEDRDGSIVLSREKARREEAWTNLEKAFESQQRVTGRSTDGSRAASPSTSAAPWRSCRAARWISDRCATSPR